MLEQLAKAGYKAVITLEEGVLAGGFGSAVLEWSMQYRSRDPKAAMPSIYCMGIQDHFVEHGARSILLDLNGLTPERIVEFATSCLA
jgi:1-deoxy-D-xylulose-5-phosphate synthase